MFVSVYLPTNCRFALRLVTTILDQACIRMSLHYVDGRVVVESDKKELAASIRVFKADYRWQSASVAGRRSLIEFIQINSS